MTQHLAWHFHDADDRGDGRGQHAHVRAIDALDEHAAQYPVFVPRPVRSVVFRVEVSGARVPYREWDGSPQDLAFFLDAMRGANVPLPAECRILWSAEATGVLTAFARGCQEEETKMRLPPTYVESSLPVTQIAAVAASAAARALTFARARTGPGRMDLRPLQAGQADLSAVLEAMLLRLA